MNTHSLDELPKPRFSAGTTCLYRKEGSVTGQVVTVGQFQGGSAGRYCFAQVEPKVDGEYEVWEKYLADIDLASPIAAAAKFISQLWNDYALMKEPKLLLEERPRFETEGLHVELFVPSDLRHEWSVEVNGKEVSRVEDTTTYSALAHLKDDLLAKAKESSS